MASDSQRQEILRELVEKRDELIDYARGVLADFRLSDSARQLLLLAFADASVVAQAWVDETSDIDLTFVLEILARNIQQEEEAHPAATNLEAALSMVADAAEQASDSALEERRRAAHRVIERLIEILRKLAPRETPV